MPIAPDASLDLWTSYQPSLPAQDWVTLPLEAATAYAISAHLPVRDEPLWPFTHERNSGLRNSSRHPGDFAMPLLGAMSLPVFAANMQAGEEFSATGFVRGWIHAHLLTEIATSFVKRSVGRHRPFYDTEAKEGRLREDDSLSFFSGHSSHAFCAATYLARMTSLGEQSALWRWGSTTLLFAGATWMAWGRAHDGQHHWDDVVVGAVAGTAISSWVFSRVESVQASPDSRGGKSDEGVVQSSLFYWDDYLGVRYSFKL
jgi:membrane-associated phospholipid phosphatase